jgi:hypothetical protein
MFVVGFKKTANTAADRSKIRAIGNVGKKPKKRGELASQINNIRNSMRTESASSSVRRIGNPQLKPVMQRAGTYEARTWAGGPHNVKAQIKRSGTPASYSITHDGAKSYKHTDVTGNKTVKTTIKKDKK